MALQKFYEGIYDSYKNRISKEDFLLLAQVDPTPTKKYVRWIVDMYLKALKNLISAIFHVNINNRVYGHNGGTYMVYLLLTMDTIRKSVGKTSILSETLKNSVYKVVDDCIIEESI